MAETLTVEELLARSTPEVREIAEALRALVREVVPGAQERANPGWKVITYSTRRICVAIAPHKDTVNLVLYNGVKLDDPDKLLQGTGKGMRHVKIAEVGQIRPDSLKHLVRQAAQLAD